MRYIHHLHTTLADIRIGEKVAIAHWPDPTASIRVSNGVVVAVSATAVRVAWEGNDRSPLDMFTEEQLGYLAFEQPEPSITVDMAMTRLPTYLTQDELQRLFNVLTSQASAGSSPTSS